MGSPVGIGEGISGRENVRNILGDVYVGGSAKSSVTKKRKVNSTSPKGNASGADYH